MNEQIEGLKKIAQAEPYKVIISKPLVSGEQYRKIVVEKKERRYQAAAYTQKQVFHRNIGREELFIYLSETVVGSYLQVNAWDDKYEYMLLCSKKGRVSYKRKQAEGTAAEKASAHNRKKKYLIEEGSAVAPLVDMGIFTAEGRVVASMYDKFRQINRFLEMIDDAVREDQDLGETLHIIDFGCGKSYLTFVLYYYFTKLKGRKVYIVGLDLKEDVIRSCNAAAQKYGYENLHFEVGDIEGYRANFPVDMVVTLHACDTATDYALFHAIRWNAKMIFSVPCCQHELNSQIKAEHLSLLTRYGVIKERFSALATDAIRANLLEYCGYKTQLLEFVDFAHTPKNILIRAVRKGGAAGKAGAKMIVPPAARRRYLEEVERLMEEFHFVPTLYTLLEGSGRIREGQAGR